MQEDKTRVLNIMGRVQLPTEEFERYYRWRDARYTRNVLSRTENFEVLLVCWEKGQSSPIHDFNSQEAWIHPIVGKLREERFKINVDGEWLELVSNMMLGILHSNKPNTHYWSNVSWAGYLKWLLKVQYSNDLIIKLN